MPLYLNVESVWHSISDWTDHFQLVCDTCNSWLIKARIFCPNPYLHVVSKNSHSTNFSVKLALKWGLQLFTEHSTVLTDVDIAQRWLGWWKRRAHRYMEIHHDTNWSTRTQKSGSCIVNYPMRQDVKGLKQFFSWPLHVADWQIFCNGVVGWSSNVVWANPQNSSQ